MNDINFFNPYLEKTNSKKSYTKYIPLIFVSILVIGLIVYQFTLNKEKRLLENTVNTIESEINDSEIQKSYRESLEAQEKMQAIKSVLDESESIANNIKEDFHITKDLVRNLVNNVPENTYIVSMKYENYSVEMECISDSYDSAAQFIHNIKKNDDEFIEVFMPYVNEENGDYKYSLNVVIGGESNETIQ